MTYVKMYRVRLLKAESDFKMLTGEKVCWKWNNIKKKTNSSCYVDAIAISLYQCHVLE